jgi:hypothetical protein
MLVVTGIAGTAHAVTEETFILKTGADLVALCAVAPEDPLRAEATHFCHGFAVGTYRTLRAVTNHRGLDPMFCPPDPPPPRTEAIAQFVVWAKQHPEFQSDPPEELLGRYLVQSFPCAQVSPTHAPSKPRHKK